MGVTNVGKSTLINRIIKQQTGISELITTSRFPGTTLDKIEIPFDDGKNLIDTPGIIHKQQMAHYLTGKSLKFASPQKEIKPKVYQLNEGQTIFLGSLARFDYISGGRTSVIAYFDNNLPLHRTKLQNADKFYEKHAGELLQPPTREELKKMPKLTRFEFKISEKSDLVFSGLGWISLSPNTIVAGWAPEGVGVLIRKAMI